MAIEDIILDSQLNGRDNSILSISSKVNRPNTGLVFEKLVMTELPAIVMPAILSIG